MWSLSEKIKAPGRASCYIYSTKEFDLKTIKTNKCITQQVHSITTRWPWCIHIFEVIFGLPEIKRYFQKFRQSKTQGIQVQRPNHWANSGRVTFKNSDLEACNHGDNILYPLGAFVYTKLRITVLERCRGLKTNALSWTHFSNNMLLHKGGRGLLTEQFWCIIYLCIDECHRSGLPWRRSPYNVRCNVKPWVFRWRLPDTYFSSFFGLR